MEPKEAVRTAKAWISDLFDDEDITDILLEEIVRRDHSPPGWRVTIGFNRPSPRRGTKSAVVEALSPPRNRVYKVVAIDDKNGNVISVEDRLLPGRK